MSKRSCSESRSVQELRDAVGLGRRADLDVLGRVELEQDDLDEAEADHEVPRILLPLDEQAVTAHELVPEAFECRPSVRHEVVEEDVD